MDPTLLLILMYPTQGNDGLTSIKPNEDAIGPYDLPEMEDMVVRAACDIQAYSRAFFTAICATFVCDRDSSFLAQIILYPSRNEIHHRPKNSARMPLMFWVTLQSVRLPVVELYECLQCFVRRLFCAVHEFWNQAMFTPFSMALRE